MTYEVIILGHFHMPLYFIGTFTEYSYLFLHLNKNNASKGVILAVLIYFFLFLFSSL